MTRIATSQIYQKGIDLILDHQSKLAKSEQHLASGKRVMTPSDDPAAAGALVRIQSEVSRLTQYQENINLTRSSLGEQESVLGQIGQSFQRFNELLLQAGNPALHEGGREAIAQEMAAIKQEILDLANTRSVDGDYLFAGNSSDTVPFASEGSVVTYQGDQGNRQMTVGHGIRVDSAINGYDLMQNVRGSNGVFSAIAASANTGSVVVSPSLSATFVPDDYTVTFNDDPGGGHTYTVTDSGGGTVISGTYEAGESISFAGVSLRLDGEPDDGDSVTVSPAARQDIFSTLQRGIDATRGDLPGNNREAVLGNVLNETLLSVEGAMDHLVAARASIGASMGILDSRETLHDDQMLALAETRVELEDLDIVSAVNELNLQRVALQAAQQAYVQIRDLSIFRYL